MTKASLMQGCQKPEILGKPKVLENLKYTSYSMSQGSF